MKPPESSGYAIIFRKFRLQRGFVFSLLESCLSLEIETHTLQMDGAERLPPQKMYKYFTAAGNESNFVGHLAK